jgi:hypothetical protein
VVFHGYRKETALVAVMGLQRAADAALIRHAYTRTSAQGGGAGSALLRRYWSVPERQIKESVVLQCCDRSEPQP